MTLQNLLKIGRLREHEPTAGEVQRLLAAIEAILDGYSRGTRFGIRMDSDGLLACGVPGVQLWWAKCWN